jgi:hypothetical protein
MINLHNAVQFLVDNGYMAIIKGKYIVTAKFNKEILGVAKGLTMLPGNIPAVIEPDIPKQISWKDMYMRFIAESKVPARIINARGEPYQVNNYSEPGMKAFRKAIEKEGVDYPTLVQATALYYQSSIAMKVAIGRFMEEGIWRTHYDEVIQHQQSGTLKDHVKTSKDEPYSRYKIG